jgi:uncharacterized protein (DUF1778 family)
MSVKRISDGCGGQSNTMKSQTGSLLQFLVLYCRLTYNGREGDLTMPRSRTRRPARKGKSPSPLMVRLDDESKTVLSQAAELRRISVSDYVRTVTLAQARKEVDAAREQSIALTADEQLAFWNALNATPPLTEAQKQLGKTMRGEA